MSYEYSRQETDLCIKEEGISIEEVTTAINKLKNGKAPGICGISEEKLKAGGRVCSDSTQSSI